MILPQDYTGLVLFSAPWCHPCKSYKPALETEAKIRGLPITHVNIDEDRGAAAHWGVRAVPTTVLYRNGIEVRRNSGAIAGAALKAFMS